ncbi:hypothetical protein N665_1403s0004 [Sinapis alba]|nr:hypothetical protein N665_1403s0004 [Sinapis alba]
MSSHDDDASDENEIFLGLGIVLIGIGVGLLLCCIIKLLNKCTQSSVPNVNTGDIELGIIDDVNGHQEILLIPVPREIFIFVHGESECNICLEEFASNDILANTLCGHAFHLHCLRSWNARNVNTCPTCRSNLV